jgi:hypothetical protein
MRRVMIVLVAVGVLLAVAGCSSEGSAIQASLTPDAGQGGTAVTSTRSFPKVGHAPDYNWIAGRVTYTKIQGGCTYIITDQSAIDAALAPTPTGNTVTGPFVGTAVKGDTSPPLRDITPQAGPPPTQPPGDRFVASGPGWDPSKTKDGDYVLLFGRLAGPGDPQEICPGGTGYVVDRMAVIP